MSGRTRKHGGIANVIASRRQVDHNSVPKKCTVEYHMGKGKWIVHVPGEGTKEVRDSMQFRAILMMLLNIRMLMEPKEISAAVSTGPVVVHGNRSLDDEPEPAHESEEGVLPDAEIDSCGNEAVEDGDTGPEAKFQSGSDPDLLMLYGFSLPRHTGDTCDRRLIHDLDRRLALLDAGIEAARACRREKLAEALGEEWAALRTLRNWYLNVVTGGIKPFYTKTDEEKAKCCRMWILRGLRTLAASGLPKAAASLARALHRGMDLVYDGQPDYDWVVAQPPPGSLPVLGKSDEEHEGGSEEAA